MDARGMRAGAVRKAAPATNKILARLPSSRSPCEISAAQLGLLTPQALAQEPSAVCFFK
jgi:hypothetical protein